MAIKYLAQGNSYEKLIAGPECKLKTVDTNVTDLMSELFSALKLSGP